MLRKIILPMTAIAASIMLLSGCSSIPKPAPGKEKPTVYIESKTAEKFKDLTEETAIWNGISPYYVKDKQYMRCDMTHEMMAIFAKNGFELVNNMKKADYKLEVEVGSCGSGTYYSGNGSNVKMSEKELYKHFSNWVENKDGKSNIPSEAKEIAKLISENNPDGFKRFFDGQYIQKYGAEFGKFLIDWKFIDDSDKKYLSKTNNIVFPNKYFKISDEDKKIISDFYKIANESGDGNKLNHHIEGMNMFSGGMGMVGNLGRGSAGGNTGAAFAAVGLAMAFTGDVVPNGINNFIIENTKTGKRHSFYTLSKEDNWNNNTINYNRYVFKKIPWKDLD